MSKNTIKTLLALVATGISSLVFAQSAMDIAKSFLTNPNSVAAVMFNQTSAPLFAKTTGVPAIIKPHSGSTSFVATINPPTSIEYRSNSQQHGCVFRLYKNQFDGLSVDSFGISSNDSCHPMGNTSPVILVIG